MDYHNVLLLLLLVLVEASAMGTIEYGANKGINIYIVGILLYLVVGYILYRILIDSGLVMTNAKWNVLSIILVTSIGIFYFREQLTIYEKFGLGFAILSIFLMEYDKIKTFIKV